MKNKLSDSYIELENSDKLMQKLKQSCMKAKTNRKKLSLKLKQNIDDVQTVNAQ